MFYSLKEKKLFWTMLGIGVQIMGKATTFTQFINLTDKKYFNWLQRKLQLMRQGI